jgi:hypothetical protein
MSQATEDFATKLLEGLSIIFELTEVNEDGSGSPIGNFNWHQDPKDGSTSSIPEDDGTERALSWLTEKMKDICCRWPGASRRRRERKVIRTYQGRSIGNGRNV